jgi:hypothetical protein
MSWPRRSLTPSRSRSSTAPSTIASPPSRSARSGSAVPPIRCRCRSTATASSRSAIRWMLQAVREKKGRAHPREARRRDHRRLQARGCRRHQARQRPPDGRRQQGVRPLRLVVGLLWDRLQPVVSVARAFECTGSHLRDSPWTQRPPANLATCFVAVHVASIGDASRGSAIRIDGALCRRLIRSLGGLRLVSHLSRAFGPHQRHARIVGRPPTGHGCHPARHPAAGIAAGLDSGGGVIHRRGALPSLTRGFLEAYLRTVSFHRRMVRSG